MAKQLVHPGDRVYYRPIHGIEKEVVIHSFAQNDANLVIVHYKEGMKVIRKTVRLSD
ncbi:hypothetical protein LCGC14_2329710, partial [marine sediment metagenome]